MSKRKESQELFSNMASKTKNLFEDSKSIYTDYFKSDSIKKNFAKLKFSS